MKFKLIMLEGGRKECHIYVYSDIDQMWGFSATDLINQLKELSPKDKIVVHINSAGGNVVEGLAIYNTLKAWQGEVETICEGTAASIASVILLAGKVRRMYDNAFLLIHGPQMTVQGTQKQIEEHVRLIEITNTNVIGIYKANLSATEDQIKLWMDGDYYMDATEAKKYGFISEIITPVALTVHAGPALEKLVAKLTAKPSTEKPVMDPFDLWLKDECEALEIDLTKLTAKAKAGLKARWEKLTAKPGPTPGNNGGVDNLTDAHVAELDRISAIEEAATTLQEDGTISLNAEYLTKLGVRGKTIVALRSHAVKQKWTVDKFELEARRSTVIAAPAAHIGGSQSVIDMKEDVLTCAVSMRMGVPQMQENKSNGIKFGLAVDYKPEVLDAASKPQFRDLSLLQMYDWVHQQAFGHRYAGRLNTDGFLAAAREALWKLRMSGNTTWSGLRVFEDASNKTLWAAYNSIPTTWQNWVFQHTVSDFKTSNFYRLTMKGGFLPVGPDGELKHGGFSDDKFTATAGTFGKIVGLSRTDLINDDMGALKGVMTALGMEGSLFLEELFHYYLLSRLTTLFPVNGSLNNYLAGANTALGVDSLSLAEELYSNQVTSDAAPILQSAAMLLHGTTLAVLADELYTKLNLRVIQASANAKGRPDDNPHVGKYRPVKSPYLNNTLLKRRNILPSGQAFTGQSATMWFLLGAANAAMGGIVIGSFLNGKTTPFIQSEDASFNVLGLQWRAFQDAGADDGDPKLGVMMKGAA